MGFTFFLSGLFSDYFRYFSSSDRKILKKNYDLIIHCEKDYYEPVFKPILDHLDSNKINILFIYMYDEIIHCKDFKGIQFLRVKSNLFGYRLMEKIRGEIFLSTTPQLNIFSFKKSKFVKKYYKIQHALTDGSNSQPFAFDHFDGVFCSGVHLKKNIRLIEEKRKRKRKELFLTGLPHFDFLKNKLNEPNRENNLTLLKGRTTIAYAPSWGARSSVLNPDVLKLIKTLSNQYQIIFRPHPQLELSNYEIFEKYKSIDNIYFDQSPIYESPIFQSDCLISDFSGIIYEYLLLKSNPVMILKENLDLDPFEGHVIQNHNNLRDDIEDYTYQLDLSTKGSLNIFKKVDEIINSERKKININNLVYEFGKSGSVTSGFLQNQLKNLKND